MPDKPDNLSEKQIEKLKEVVESSYVVVKRKTFWTFLAVVVGTVLSIFGVSIVSLIAAYEIFVKDTTVKVARDQVLKYQEEAANSNKKIHDLLKDSENTSRHVSVLAGGHAVGAKPQVQPAEQSFTLSEPAMLVAEGVVTLAVDKVPSETVGIAVRVDGEPCAAGMEKFDSSMPNRGWLGSRWTVKALCMRPLAAGKHSITVGSVGAGSNEGLYSVSFFAFRLGSCVKGPGDWNCPTSVASPK